MKHRVQLAEISHFEARIIRKKAALGSARTNTRRAYIQAGIDHSDMMINRIKAGMVKS